jgi:1A family penicillin-binding protein
MIPTSTVLAHARDVWRRALPFAVIVLRRVRGLGAFGLATLILAGVLALSLIAAVAYTAIELARFQRVESRRTTLVYAAGPQLVPGVNVLAIDLAGTLRRLKYAEVRAPVTEPGQFRRDADAWELYLRGTEDDHQRHPARVRLELQGERIAHVMRDGQALGGVVLEPEILTSAATRPGEEYHPVGLADAPRVLVQAVLAAEDHRFFEHGGLDVRGMLRAAWANLRAGRVRQGGSTITQQLVKNRLLGSERTYGRKVREAWLATAIEWRYSKEQILEAYLNEIYLGQRGSLAIRGVGAAARAYFRKEVHQLALTEAALIAGMARAPNSYSPAANPERARQRRDAVLGRMRELGWISAADFEAGRRQPIRVRPVSVPGQWAPYFIDYVRQEVEQRLGVGVIDSHRGARVYTPLDLTLQRFAEAAVARGLGQLEGNWPRLRRADPAERLQAALIALDPTTGEIRALVGGREYRASQFNRAVLARRQPGSAFKPFVYLAALSARRGGPAFTPATFVDDTPLTLNVGTTTWSPRNYEDRYEGRVTVRRALEQSLNAATVRMALEIGLPAVIETARDLGIPSPLAPVPATVLGASEVTPLELAGAYLPFANGGVRHPNLSAVNAVYEENGARLGLQKSDAAQVVPPAEAYVITSLLQGVIDAGTASSVRGLSVPGTVAGKTGTTNDGRDAWFVGYTPTLLALVWVGFDNGEAHGLSGAQAALPIWAEFMKPALDAYPAPTFVVPAGVTTVKIDATNGRGANLFCPVVISEIFLAGTEPAPCDEHGGVPTPILNLWRRFSDWFGR